MKVSVIIPVYNVEPYIKECLYSVLVQTLKDLEVICIHDAGHDGSWEIVKTVAAADPRIRTYENEQNIGLAATRNRGLRLARGRYVYFLDSDDMIMPDALAALYERAEGEQLEVQIFGASFLYETKELEEKFHNNPAVFKREYPNVMGGRELFAAWMDPWDWQPSQPRYFYRRDFLERCNICYTEGMLHEDEEFAFDVLMHAQRVRVTSERFFIRRFREDSIMTSLPTAWNVEACVKILMHVAGMQEIYKDDEALNKAVKFYMYKIFNDACRKYRAAAFGRGTEGGSTMIQSMLQETEDEAAMAICHLVEAMALNGA